MLNAQGSIFNVQWNKIKEKRLKLKVGSRLLAIGKK